QSREINALCSGWESMRVTARSMLDASGDDKLIPFVIHGHVEDREVKDLPQYTKVIKGEENIAAFKAWANQYDFQRPLMVPPKTPKDRLLALRTGLQKTLTNPEFLAEARKSKLVIDNVTGADVEKSVDEILSISPSVKKKLAVLLPGKTN
ncbi:MAG: hypothetical protein ACREQV_13665, partial [Candidatus Binatia bacterium]